MSKWAKVRLGDVCDIARGGSPRPIDSFITENDNGINWIKIGDTTDDDKYIRSTRQKIKPEGIKKSRFVQSGDFLLTNSMSFGRPYILAIDGCIHDGWLVLSDKGNHFDKTYLYYALSSKTTYRKFQSLAVGGVVNNLNSDIVKGVEFPLPPIEEQRKIAAMLDAVADLLKIRKQQLAELDKLVKSQFIEMFGAYSGSTTKAGTLFHNMRNGVSPSTKGKHYEKVLTLSAITQGAFDANAWKDGYFDSCPPDDKRISKSDFYMCRGNGNRTLVGTGVYTTENRPDLVFPDTAIAASIDEREICLPYLCNAWKQPFVRRQIEDSARTTNGIYKINQSIISNIEIILPPVSLQMEFVRFAEQSNKSKIIIQQSIDQTQALFDSLMSEYFD